MALGGVGVGGNKGTERWREQEKERRKALHEKCITETREQKHTALKFQNEIVYVFPLNIILFW